MSDQPLPQINGHAGAEQKDDYAATDTRSRASHACESCRMLKIRCISSGSPDIASCENCDKSGTTCLFVPRARTRRRKRADVRVTDLEKEVRALASLLRQSENGKHTGEQHPIPPEIIPSPDVVRQFTAMHGEAGGTFPTTVLPNGSTPLALVFSSNENDRLAYGSTPTSLFLTNLTPPEQVPNNLQQGLSRSVASNTSSLPNIDHRDAIDRGVLDWTTALQLFTRYQRQLTPCYPIVPLSDDISPAVLRREKPVLFLATIAAAAAISSEYLRNELHEEILQTYANHVMIQGVKSLELLQAMLITVAWYRPCNAFNDTKYLQYSQAASLMAIELGIGKPGSKTPMQNQDLSGSIHGLANSKFDDSESTECHRTLVAAYVQSSNIDLISHVSMVSPVAGQVATSFQVLESSSNRSDCDKDFLIWARLQLLTQEACHSLSRDDSKSNMRIADAHSHLMLSAFETQLRKTMGNRMSSQQNPCLKITFHADILHLNEIALHEDYDRQDFRRPFSMGYGSTKADFKMGAPYINAIMKCISSSHELIDTLLAMDHSTLGSIPIIIFVRMAYAAVVLFKIFLLVTSAGHPLGTIMSGEQLRVSHYIDSLQKITSDLSHYLSFQGANKFLDIILRMKHSYDAHLATLGPANCQKTDTADLANYLVISNTSLAGGQYTDPGGLAEFSSGQAFPFTFQDANGSMPDVWDLSVNWEASIPDSYEETM